MNCPGQGNAHLGQSPPGRAVSLTRLQSRRSARAAESARLEIVCWATNRGFKSHLLRSESSTRVSIRPIGQRGPRARPGGRGALCGLTALAYRADAPVDFWGAPLRSLPSAAVPGTTSVAGDGENGQMTTDLTGDSSWVRTSSTGTCSCPIPTRPRSQQRPRPSRTRTSWTSTTPISIGRPRSARTPSPRTERETAARAGAAYDRIVDTVRRSVEEPSRQQTRAGARLASSPSIEPEPEPRNSSLPCMQTRDADVDREPEAEHVRAGLAESKRRGRAGPAGRPKWTMSRADEPAWDAGARSRGKRAGTRGRSRCRRADAGRRNGTCLEP